MPTQAQYQAKMGFVGSVRLLNAARIGGGTGGQVNLNQFVRVTSCNITAKQEVTPEEVIDGRMDRILYSIKGRSVDGSMEFPLVHDGDLSSRGDAQFSCRGLAGGQGISIAQSMWQMAAVRDPQGRLAYEFDTVIRYNSSVAYKYPSCLLKKVGLTVTQGDLVKMTAEVEGRGRQGNPTEGWIMREEVDASDVIGGDPKEQFPDLKAPVRAVTFNDFRLGVFYRTGGSVDIPGEYIRSFNVNLDNNVERIYTLNGSLAPIDVVAKKRTVEGEMTLMGFADQAFRDAVYNNQNFTSSNNKIQFGYSFGSSSSVYFGTSLHGVIFQIESVDVKNDLVETRIPFKAMGHCENEYEAIEIGAADWNPRVYQPGQTAGGATSPGYFQPI
jgi:hypothetical protein